MSIDLNVLLDDILEEVKRAETKFPQWPVDPIHAIAVLNEEVGELNKAVLEAVYTPLGIDDLVNLEEEAIQVAAMAIRFLKNTNKYEYKPCEQTRVIY